MIECIESLRPDFRTVEEEEVERLVGTMPGTEVYADLTFVTNFAMDFLILWATVRLRSIKVVWGRITLAAGLGGIYAAGYLFPGLAAFYSLPAKIIFSLLMLLIALGYSGPLAFLKSLLYFYLLNFAVAGATLAASYMFPDSSFMSSSLLAWLAVGVTLAILAGLFGEKLFVKRMLPRLLRFPVEIRFGNQQCRANGFLDTGNGLRDPLTNRPVLVAEYGVLRNYLPEDFQRALEKGASENADLEALGQSSWAGRLRLIPFNSIGKRNGMLVGVRADEVTIHNGSEQIKHRDLVVGLYLGGLSADGSYQMLIPSEVLQMIGG